MYFNYSQRSVVFLWSSVVAHHHKKKQHKDLDGLKMQELYIVVIAEEKTNSPGGLTLWLPQRQRLPKPHCRGCPPHCSRAQGCLKWSEAPLFTHQVYTVNDRWITVPGRVCTVTKTTPTTCHDPAFILWGWCRKAPKNTSTPNIHSASSRHILSIMHDADCLSQALKRSPGARILTARVRRIQKKTCCMLGF